MPSKQTCICCGRTFYDADNVDFCPDCYEANCPMPIGNDYYQAVDCRVEGE